jgi:hypothetical protein
MSGVESFCGLILSALLVFIRMIKAAKLRWGGHLQRMGNNKISRRIVDSKLEWCKRMGRPKLRWIDGVVKI